MNFKSGVKGDFSTDLKYAYCAACNETN